MKRFVSLKSIIILTLMVFIWGFLSLSGLAAGGGESPSGWYWYLGQKVKDADPTPAYKNPKVTSYTRDNEIDVTVHEFPEPSVTATDTGYHHMEMEGLDSIANIGEPVLPVKGVNVLVPNGKKIKNSYVVLGDKIEIEGSYNLELGRNPVPLSQDEPEQSNIEPKARAYQPGTVYPREKRREIATQLMNGYKIASFTLHPVEYSPEDGSLAYYKDMSLKVDLEDDTENIQPLGICVLRGSEADLAKVESFIANSQDVVSYNVPLGLSNPSPLAAAPFSPSATDTSDGDRTVESSAGALGARYIVITTENLKNTPAPFNFDIFCREKEQRDISTGIVTTEWIYANYSGRDQAEKIRNFIKDTYMRGTDYVLLGGDASGNTAGSTVVPVRYLYDEPWPGSEYATDKIPSDMYYACLDGTMDANRNGVYGEPEDGTDLIPEILVGRAPVSTHAEVINFVKKNLTYRRSNSQYLLNTYQIGEYLGYGGVTEYAKTSLEEIKLGSTANGYITEGFTGDTNLKLNTLYDYDRYFAGHTEWSIDELINLINGGVHIINHLGHGYVSFGLGLNTADIDRLTNTDYFFAYSQACLQGSFDNDCIVEHYVKSEHGAFAFIANARYGWAMEYSTAGPSQLFAREFWDGVFGEGIRSLGEAHLDAKWDNFNYIRYSCMRWCYLELNLFGDPEMEFKLDGPSEPVTTDTVEGSLDDSQVGDQGSAIPQEDEDITLEAQFTAFPTHGTAPVIVSFANLSSGDIASWGWDFGDGIISSKQNTWHIYRRPGTYTVSLAITDSKGHTVREAKTGYVVVTGSSGTTAATSGAEVQSAAYSEPGMDEPGNDMGIAVRPETKAVEIVQPSTTDLDGADSDPYVGEDDQVVPVPEPAIDEEPAAEDDRVPQGASGSGGSQTIAEGYTPPQAPIADFDMNIMVAGVPAVINFRNLSNGGIASYEWTFGDGDTANSESPTHRYVYSGTYTARLKVIGAGGEDITEKTVRVVEDEPPVAKFITSIHQGSAPLNVYFADDSEGEITSWLWNFGDGSTSAFQNTNHSYTTPGSYTVSLTVSGPTGTNRAVMSNYVIVSQGQVAEAPAATSRNLITITHEFPEPRVIEEANQKFIVEMDGVDSIGNSGEPLLPVKGVNVLIPVGKTVVREEVICGERVVLTGTYDVNHAQVPAPLSISTGFKSTGRNKEIYDSDDVFPKEKKETIADQELCGYEISTFTLHPVEYKPKSGELAYYKSMTINIYLEDKPAALADSMATLAGVPRPLVRNNIRDRQRVAEFVDNPEDISTYDSLASSVSRLRTLADGGPGAIRPLGFCSPTDNGGRGFEYVVITNQRLRNASGPYNFQTLIQEKIDRGVTATIVTTEQIYAEYSGTRPDGEEDNATRIRNFIKDAYNNWDTQYILLGGDATGHPHEDYEEEIIPVRFLYNEVTAGENAEEEPQIFRSDGSEPTGPMTFTITFRTNIYNDSYANPLGGYEAEIPSDLYYCCLDGTMDENGDGVYGDARSDDVDLLAEVYIGRAPVVTEEELSNFVRKTLEYKNGQPHILETLNAGEHLGFGGVAEYAKDSLEEIRLGSNAHEYETRGFAEFEYLSLNTLYDFDYVEASKQDPNNCNSCGAAGWPKEDLIDIINNGIHVINHLGHANETIDMKLHIEDVDALTNRDYFFGYSQGCLPGSFETDCIVEHMVKNPTGAFAFVANSRYGWGEGDSTAGPSNYYARQFWDAVFGEFKWKLGEANQSSKEDNLWTISYPCHRWCYYELNLFGDPELSFKFDLSDGFINLKESIYNTSSVAEIFLIDSDLEASDTITVEVTSQTEPQGERVVLNRKYSDLGIFEGVIQLEEAEGPKAGDGKIQVAVIDEIAVIYNEEDPNEVERDTAEVDGIAPKITSEVKFKATGLTIRYGGCAEVEWTTDEPSNACVYYGTSSAPNKRACAANYFMDQKVSFCGLPGNTIIYFYVQSTDRAGNIVKDDNDGQYYQMIIKAPTYETSSREFTFDIPEGSTEPLTGEVTITNTAEDPDAESLQYLYRLNPNKHLKMSASHSYFFDCPDEYQSDYGDLYQGNSTTLSFTINPKELKAGAYKINVNVETNSSDGDFTISVTVNAAAAPAVHFSNYYLIDDKTEDRRCDNTNGDGRLNAGETVALNFEVKNNGSLEAVGGYAHLVLLKEETIYDPNEDACPICGWIHGEDDDCDEDDDGELDEDEYYNWKGYPLERIPAESSCVSIIDDSVNLGSIAPGDVKKSIGNFILSASQDAEIGVIATLAIDIWGNDNAYHWYEEIELCINVNRYAGPSIAGEQTLGGNIWNVDMEGVQSANAMQQVNGKWVSVTYFVWMDDRWLSETTVDGYTIGAFSQNEQNDIYFQAARADVFDEDKDQSTEDLILGDVVCIYGGHDAQDVWLESNGEDVYVMYLTRGEKIVDDMSRMTQSISFMNSHDYGSSWGSSGSLASSERVWSPSMSTSGENIYVIWSDQRNSSWYLCDSDIYINTSSNGGNSWSGDEMLVAGGHEHYVSSPIIQTAGDHIYVLWVDYRTMIDDGNDIYFKHCKFGEAWSGDILVSNQKPSDQSVSNLGINMSADGNGNVYISWQDPRNSEPITYELEDGQIITYSGPSDLFVAISSDHGNTWAVEERVGADPAGQGSVRGNAIQTDSEGNLYVTWTETRNGVIYIFISKYDVKTGQWTHDMMETDVQVDEGTEHISLDNAIFGPTKPIPIVSERMGLLAIIWLDSHRKDTYGNLFMNFNSSMIDTTGVINFDVVGQIEDKIQGIIGEYLINPFDSNYPGAMDFDVTLCEETQTGIIVETRLLFDILGGMHAPMSLGPCWSKQVFLHPFSYAMSPQLVIDADGDGKPDLDPDGHRITDTSPNKLTVRAGGEPVTIKKLILFPGELKVRLFDSRETMAIFSNTEDGAGYELNITETLKNLYQLTFTLTSNAKWMPGAYDCDLLVQNEYGGPQLQIPLIVEVLEPQCADADFTNDKPGADIEEEITFINLTKYLNIPASSVTKYLWDFGDERTEETMLRNEQVRHIYSAAGRYDVSLMVEWNKTGGGKATNTETKEAFVIITRQSGYGTPDFKADVTEIEEGKTVSFTNLSTGRKIKSYSWDFDGDSVYDYLEEAGASYLYPAAGTYTVSLKLAYEKEDGSLGEEVETKSNYITVTAKAPDPIAGFTFREENDSSPIKAGQNVIFTNTTSNTEGADIGSYVWVTGDGGVTRAYSVSEDFAHKFETAGDWSVTLTVQKASSRLRACGPVSMTVHIEEADIETQSGDDVPDVEGPPVVDPVEGPPQVDIADEVSVITAGGEFIVGTTVSLKCDGSDAAKYLWSYGDGSSDIKTSNEEVYHTYYQPGSKNIKVYLYAANGARLDTVEKDIFIDNAPIVDTGVNFTYSVIIWSTSSSDDDEDDDSSDDDEIDEEPPMVADVIFGNRSDESFTSFIWYVDDVIVKEVVEGESSTLWRAFPAGKFKVTLEGKKDDRLGTIASKTHEITITEEGEIKLLELPQPDISVSERETFITEHKVGKETEEYTEVTVTNMISGDAPGLENVESYSWSAGGGTIMSENSQEAVIRFQYEGRYRVTLSVKGKSGNSNDTKSISTEITVLKGDIAIVADPTWADKSTTIKFEAVTSPGFSIPDDAKLTWDFESRYGTQEGWTAEYYYQQRPATTTFTVTLTVESASGEEIVSDIEWITIRGFQDSYGYGNFVR